MPFTVSAMRLPSSRFLVPSRNTYFPRKLLRDIITTRCKGVSILLCAFLGVIAKIIITVHLLWDFRPRSLHSSCWKRPKPSLWFPASWRFQQPWNRRARRSLYWKEEGSTTSLSRGTEKAGNGWYVWFNPLWVRPSGAGCKGFRQSYRVTT